ncbi:MAG: hypothetical protein RBR35_19430 [Salinivirgaceae bacterium]|nr:hypothetical protein [Salinivirgaceae bacterium]
MAIPAECGEREFVQTVSAGEGGYVHQQTILSQAKTWSTKEKGFEI